MSVQGEAYMKRYCYKSLLGVGFLPVCIRECTTLIAAITAIKSK